MSVFAAMMVGVGGYQAAASHTIGAFMLGADPEPSSVVSIGVPAGSALSMCGLPAGDEAAPILTLHAGDWRHSSGSPAGHSATGLVNACN
jgi:hypothetical protein